MELERLREVLNEKDRDFILIFFNLALDLYMNPEEFDIDAHLKENSKSFFTLCNFIYKNRGVYNNLKHKFY